MSDQERTEITEEQSTASEQEQTQQEAGQSEMTENANTIPEKFLNSSKMDLIQAYQEVEKDKGRIASELGELRKEREDLEARYRQQEVQYMQQAPQATTQQQVPTQTQVDPLSVLDERFEDDPKGAIRAAMQGERELWKNQNQQQFMQEQQSRFIDYYQTQKKDNPDFARREGSIHQLSARYGHLIRPEYQNSVEALQALDLMSKGNDVAYYKQTAVDEAQKQRASVLDEKRNAQSESSNSQGDRSVNLDDLSNDEYVKRMEDLYGYSDK